MDKTEYITKCEALLQVNPVYQHLSKDTSQTIHKELIKILQDYHWKFPANNSTAKYIGETNRSLKKVSDHRNQNQQCHQKPPHFNKNTQKAELKHFIIVGRDSNSLHH